MRLVPELHLAGDTYLKYYYFTGQFSNKHCQVLNDSGSTNAKMSYDMSSLTSHDGDNDDKPNMPRVAGPETDDMNPANSGAGDDLLPPERPSGMPGSRPGNSGVIYPAEPELGLVRFVF
jgi:hypothetical protein